MTGTLQVKRFAYDQEAELNEFIKTVDIPASGALHFRDNGIVLVYSEKRTHHGFTKKEHEDTIRDEIGRAEADLADALLQQSETELGFQNFKGKRGGRKVADAFLAQMAKDADTVMNKSGKIRALKSLLENIESGTIKIGTDAVDEFFKEPLVDESEGQDTVQDGVQAAEGDPVK